MTHPAPAPWPAAAPTRFAAFCAPVGDRNPRGMAGARRLASAWATATGAPVGHLGAARPTTDLPWDQALAAARDDLLALARFVDDALGAGARPVIATNRCAASVATLPVVARHRPEATVVWFDAHADANTPETSASGYLGGMVLSAAAGLWDSGLGAGLPLSRVVLVGTRDMDPAEQALVDGGLLRHVPAGPDVAARLDALLGPGPVHVHVDCDVLSPGLVPTEYQVPGGLSLADMQAAAEVLARREVVGLEVAEFEATWPDRPDAPADLAPLLHALAPLWRSGVAA